MIDLSDLDNFACGFPHDVFALVRRQAPVFWHEPSPHTPDGEGFWSVATYEEIVEVLRDAVTFSSETGGDRPYGGTVLEDQPVAGQILNMMDDPRHQRIRRIAGKGFTAPVLAQFEDELRRRARVLVEAAVERRECDFLVDVATELPLQAICILLGVPEDDRHMLSEVIRHAFDFPQGDAFAESEELAQAGAELVAYASKLIAEKRARPCDDMLSLVVHADLTDEEPPRLTDEELQLFFTLLFAAGAHTTRNASAGGVLAMTEFPDAWAALADDRSLLPTAIEESVRWSSPVAHNRRTATRDVDFYGHAVRAGDKVVVWGASANRDEGVFTESMRFDVRRDPNPHVGFGFGIHHCMGANLARLELQLIYEQLFDRVARVELTGPPEWTRSNRHTGLRHLPVRLVPR